MALKLRPENRFSAGYKSMFIALTSISIIILHSTDCTDCTDCTVSIDQLSPASLLLSLLLFSFSPTTNSMATPLLITIDPASPPTVGLTLQQVAYFGRTLVKVANRPQACDFLRQNVRLLDVYVDATDLVDGEDVVDLLNAGAERVFVSLEQLTRLSSDLEVPSSRLVACVSSDHEWDRLKAWRAESNERAEVGVCAGGAGVAAMIGKDPAIQERFKSYAGDVVTEEAIHESAKQGIVSIVPAEALTVERNDSGRIAAARMLAVCAVPDQHTGLYATSVTDERGVSLGLVWSSNESMAEALRTGTGVYQSRKRGLWYKGRSSGDVQELVRVSWDCDGDCLCFVVKQKGRGMYVCMQATQAEQTGLMWFRCGVNRILPYRHRELLWAV
jgi:phosphoribosyl-ATP pyrophosphohydrolase/phosphoribosyl-AMP cyclohydrolase/histidinol dehydrogenase